MAGGTFSALTLNNPVSTPASSEQVLAQTKLAFNRNNNLYTMSLSSLSATRLSLYSVNSTSGRAAWAPDGSRLVVNQVDPSTGYAQLYLTNANGTGLTRISDGTSPDTDPGWCTANNKVVFDRYDNSVGRNQIYSMNYNGSGLVRISDGTSTDLYPCWSPAGDRIAFVRIGSNSYSHISVMHADGTNIQDITSGFGSNLSYPAWSPDGNKIAFAIQGGSPGIDFISPNGSGVVPVTTGVSANDNFPTWSPNSAKLAFARYNSTTTVHQIWTCGSDGTQLTQVSDGTYDDSYPAWSPYVASRRLIGSGGYLTSGAGFMAGQQGKMVSSVVVFNATTPTTAYINTPAQLVQGQSTLALTVTADTLTSLVFTNNFAGLSTILGGTTTASGATVTFDASDGTVSTVLPFSSTKASARPDARAEERQGGTLILHRQFIGVWDKAGKNLAPRGAAEVRVDAKSGRLVSFR